jgi:hypothetical protein
MYGKYQLANNPNMKERGYKTRYSGVWENLVYQRFALQERDCSV